MLRLNLEKRIPWTYDTSDVHSSVRAPTATRRVIDCDALTKELASRQQPPSPSVDTVITVKITLSNPDPYKRAVTQSPLIDVLQLTDAWLERSLADLTTRLAHLSLKRSLFITDVFRDKREPLAVSSLRFLDLANCIFLPWFDMASLTQFHSLRGLVLEGCYPLLATSFAPSRPMITNLVLLNIERIFVCNREVQVVLLQGANLQYLFLGHTGFDGEVFETVWRLLRNQRPLRLTHVCLRCTQIQELHLNKLLQMTPRLQWLAATSADMSPAAKEHVEQYLPSSCQYLEVGPGNPRSAAFCGHSVPL
ncbi:hypothetical protein HPB49_020808 [Dermacentor silvarum]|uniref:Uncharacterized protein n=1 Tax=Dermacentor silvarum TaxID=543639 RepID=A0ACB8CZU6_DERSI|nr:hypothetical protein HPB49_020808 [Dermacentor silvarum]